MWKKIGIGVGIVLLLAAGGMAYLNHQNRTLSPPGSEFITTTNGLELKVDYSRPSVRERLVFGKEKDGALQPYGKYWRLGANEATMIQFNQKVSIAGTEVEAGSYQLYAVPQPDQFIIGLNPEWNRWGYSEPDYEADILKTKAPIIPLDSSVEQFTISSKESENGVVLTFLWDKVSFELEINEVE